MNVMESNKRVVKYCCYCKKRKRMYEVLHLHLDTTTAENVWATVKGYDVIEQKDIHIQVQPEDAIITQFTGLTDKNGVEVYEGDVIKSPMGIIVEVLWGNKIYTTKTDAFECNGWIVRNAKGETETLDTSFCAGEVIGNIYQKPELLTPHLHS